MNLGLRDAISLGPILAERVKNSEDSSAADDGLRKWADDRHAQALRVIDLAKGMLGWAGAKNTFSLYYGIVPVNWYKIRNLILWVGGVTGVLKKKLPWRLSGLLNR